MLFSFIYKFFYSASAIASIIVTCPLFIFSFFISLSLLLYLVPYYAYQKIIPNAEKHSIYLFIHTVFKKTTMLFFSIT